MVTIRAPHQEILLSPGDYPYRTSHDLPSLRLDTPFHDLVLFAAAWNFCKSANPLSRRCVECTDTPQRSLKGPPTTKKNRKRVDQMATHLLAQIFPWCRWIQQIDADEICLARESTSTEDLDQLAGLSSRKLLETWSTIQDPFHRNRFVCVDDRMMRQIPFPAGLMFSFLTVLHYYNIVVT